MNNILAADDSVVQPFAPYAQPFEQQQLALELPEAAYYLTGKWGYFTILALDPDRPRWEQGQRISFSYPLNQLHERLWEWSQRGKIERKNVYISQCVFNRPCRRRAAFHSVGQLFVDLDVYNAPYQKVRELSRNQVITQVYKICDAHKLPYPSIILSSGRGFYLKWFINRLPENVLLMWEHTQTYLVKLFQALGSDANAKDASRILRLENTFNYKNNMLAEVVEINWREREPARYEYHELSNVLLPYTLEAAQNFNAKQAEITAEFSKKRREITREINQRKLVLECLQELSSGGHDKGLTAQKLHGYIAETRGKGKVSIKRCDELLKRWEVLKTQSKKSGFGNVLNAKSLFSQKNLAWTRYGDINRLARHRYPDGAVEDGKRNAFFLYACNFYALSESRHIKKDFYQEFSTIGQILVPHWSYSRRCASSSDVYKRLKSAQEGQVRSYKNKEYVPLLTPKNKTLIELLGITTEEMQATDSSGQFLLKTIIDKDEKARRKPIHQKRRRRAAGVIPRLDYEANSLAYQKPWQVLGMSRTNWYRRGKPQPE